MKPILFNTEMVHAILEGRKTVTRRVVKPNYRDDEIGFNIITNSNTGAYVRIEYFDEWENETRYMHDPYRPGDILYVRETWDRRPLSLDGPDMFYYKADGDLRPDGWRDKWRPSIHMPREAARLFLRVTDVRVERLWDITEEQAVKEGFYRGWSLTEKSSIAATAKQAFMWFWDKFIKIAQRVLYGWAANPWVWVIEFERISKEEVQP